MVITKYAYPSPVTIVLLCDLHNTPYKAVIEKTAALRPDIIAVAGDVIMGHQPRGDTPVAQMQENVLPFLRECAAIAPTFMSSGNHEWMLGDTDISLIRSTGIILLDNEYVGFKGVTIGGLTSAYRTVFTENKGSLPNAENSLYPDFDKFIAAVDRAALRSPNTDWLDEFEMQHGYKILLCHHPEYRDPYLSKRKIDLILSGHGHGGQIRLFGRGLFSPGQGIFPKYTKGIYGNMIVSAGLSNTGGIVPRFFNPTEIVYISSRLKFESEKDTSKGSMFNMRMAYECSCKSISADSSLRTEKLF